MDKANTKSIYNVTCNDMEENECTQSTNIEKRDSFIFSGEQEQSLHNFRKDNERQVGKNNVPDMLVC